MHGQGEGNDGSVRADDGAPASVPAAVDVERFPVELADTLNDAVIVFAPDGDLEYLNQAAVRLLRVQVPLASSDVRSFVDDEDHGRFDDAIELLHRSESWSGSLTVRSDVLGTVPTRSTMRRLDDGRIGWVARDATTERAVIASLRERAFYDRTTGLPHRSLFLDRLDSLLRDVERGEPVAVIELAPDRFQSKVSRLSSVRGPTGLRQIAARLQAAAPERSSVHRWADEHFVVLVEGGDEHTATAAAEQLRDTFLEPVPVGTGSVYFTPSVGVAWTCPGELGTDALLRRADAALQQARRVDGAAICCFDEVLETRIARESLLEAALDGVVGRGELELHYQPEIDLRTGRLVACEALLRWQHPEWGAISPAEFIPVAEQSDVIVEIGTWVLDQAAEQSVRWQHAFPNRHDFSIAVNISARQFSDARFVDIVTRILTRTGAAPAALCLEITESLLLDDVEDTIAKLEALRSLGLRVAIDDFGTGYSSLSYLRRFPVDVLKVDRTFVSGLGHDAEDSAIVQAVVHMGQALQLSTVAEGVETAHHVIELRELGCDVAQGYHYSPPVNAVTFTEFLADDSPWTSGTDRR